MLFVARKGYYNEKNYHDHFTLCKLCFRLCGTMLFKVLISEPVMHLADYYHSFAATSFKVFCDQSYAIKFSSQNLRSSDGSKLRIKWYLPL